jgi:BirA family biotin operon repressor/biotin-[acetyl-CoA-carboxylase] ligase
MILNLRGKNTEIYPLICLMDCLFVGQNIIELTSVDSTNSYLTKLTLDDFIPEGTVVIANQQLEGRGQRGNSWLSEPNKSLIVSILLLPKIELKRQFLFNKFIALSVCQVLSHYGLCAKIKWPNDILINDKKISGVLIENTIRFNKIEKSIVGIGINVSNNLESISNATSLEMSLEKTPSIDELLPLLCEKIEKNYLLFKQDSTLINELYHKNLYKIGEEQMFVKDEYSFSGIIKFVNESGQLVVEINGKNELYNWGDLRFNLF